MSVIKPAPDLNCQQIENDALFVNDLKALASQLNGKLLEARQRGFKIDLHTKAIWKTDENYLRERIELTVWREVS